MGTLRKSATIIAPFFLILLIGSVLLGVRFGKNFLEKKLLTTINARILKNFSGELAWKKVSFDLFQSTLTFEDVSFSTGKDTLLAPLSVKKVQVRYSLLKLIGSGRLFFPCVRLEGLKGKWTAPAADALQGRTPGVPILSNGEIVHRSLLKARAFLKKVDVLDGAWEIDLPSMGRKIYFQQIEFHSDLSSKNSLTVQASTPRIRVIGPSQDKYFRDEYFSLPKASFCLAKDSLRFDSLSLSTSTSLKGEEIELKGEISHLFDGSPSLALFYQGRVNWWRRFWYPHLFSHGSPHDVLEGSPLVTRGEIGGTVENPMVKGALEVEDVRFYPQGRELSGNPNQPCFTASHVKSHYLLEKHKITLSQVSFFTASGASVLSGAGKKKGRGKQGEGETRKGRDKGVLSAPKSKPGKVSGQAEFSFPDQKFSIAASADGLELLSVINSGIRYQVSGISEKTKNSLNPPLPPLQKGKLLVADGKLKTDNFLHKIQSKIQKEYPIVGGTASFQGRLLQNCQPGKGTDFKSVHFPPLTLIGSGEFDVRLSGSSQKEPLFWKAKFSLPGKGTIRVDTSSLILAGNSLTLSGSVHGDLNYSGAENRKEKSKGKSNKNFNGNFHGNFHDIGFDARLENIAGLSVLWPAIKSSGAGGVISFTGTVAGPFSDPQVSGSLNWQDAVFRRFSAQKIEGVVRYDQKSFFLSNLHLQQNQTSVTVDGKISALTGEGDLHAEADPIYYDDLEQILKLQAPVLIKGRMACQSDFQILPGSQQKFLGRGQVTTGEWSIAYKRHPSLKQHFDSVTSAFEVDGNKFQLDHTIGNLGRQEVHAELIFPYHHSVSDLFRFSSEDWDLSYLDTIQEQKIPLKGKSSFQIMGKGGIGSGDWDWNIMVHQPQYEGFSLDQVIASVQMQGKEYHGEVRLAENKFFVQGNMEKGISYQLVGQIPQLKVEPDLSYLCGMLKNKMPNQKMPNEKIPYQEMPYQDPKNSHPLATKDVIHKDKVFVEFSGQVKASGYLNNFQQSAGEFLASKAIIYTPLHTFCASQPFTVAYDQARIFISDSYFTGEGVEAKLKGEARLGGETIRDRQLDFSFTGVVPMTYLEQKRALLFGSVASGASFASEAPTGNVQFDLSLKGSPGSLKFSGRLKAADCSFDLPRLNRRVEAVQGDLFIDEKAITISRLTGTCHEGKFELSGKLNVQDFEITSVDLNLKGENILLASPARYKFIINEDLRVQGSKEHSDLTGVINVREGRYHRDVGIMQSLLTRQRKIDVGEKGLSDFRLSDTEWLDNTSFNVRVSIPQDVWVKSSFFTAEIARSEFFMKGNFSHPYPEGQVRTINGAILLGGNKFQIISGLLDLTDPEREDTSMDILASADIDAYRITANIFGPVDDPQIRLSSTPYLSQTDILNMIALGISSDGGAGGELTGQPNMGSPLISDIFGKEVTSFSGIDLFRAKVLNRDLFRVDLFKFKVGEESGAVEKITVGRDITKRLQLKYSIPAGEEKREIAEVDYKLSDYIKLIGSQDDLGTYSLDLNFSFEF